MGRRENIGSSISNIARLAAVYLICFSSIVFAISFLSSLAGLELIAIPLAILVANFVEYASHRWPMHKRLKLIGRAYKTHSGEHHRFFTKETMEIEQKKDVFAALAKPRTVLFFLVFILVPVSAALSVISYNFAAIFFVSSLIYYLLHEFTHMVTHLPEQNFFRRLPYFRNAIRHHSIHHDPRMMHKYNFNIGLPLMDKLFKTYK